MTYTIIKNALSNGKFVRTCARCLLHVNENNQIDLDFYTARQYLEYMAIPEESRCKHRTEGPPTNNDLIYQVEHVAMNPELADLLKNIIRRLK